MGRHPLVGKEAKKAHKERARQRILQAIVGAISFAKECDELATANEIENQGTLLAKQWKYEDVPGLPKTFKKLYSAKDQDQS